MSDEPMRYPDGQEVQYRDYVRNTQNNRHARVTMGFDTTWRRNTVCIQYVDLRHEQRLPHLRTAYNRWSVRMFTEIPVERLELVSRKGPETE